MCETGAHRPGQSVLRGIVSPCSLVGLSGIARESVPDAVKIDSLTSLDQALGIGTVEGEMPQGWISNDFIPGPDTGDRRVHDDEPFHLVRVTRCIGVGDHDADVVRNTDVRSCPSAMTTALISAACVFLS